MTEDQNKQSKDVDTGGGASIDGDVNTGGGDSVGRDKVTIIHQPSNPKKSDAQETSEDMPAKKLSPQIGAAIIMTVGAIIVAIFAYFGATQPTLLEIHSTQTAEARHTAVAITETANAVSVFQNATATPTSVPTQTATKTIRPTSTLVSCACQLDAVKDTLECLIHSESEAALAEDLSLIQQIFAPDAVIFDGAEGSQWDSPTAYYAQAWNALDLSQPQHYDLQEIVIAARSAKFTSGSRGSYTITGQEPALYDNPNPSDHWVFGLDSQGCWVITRFEFNAGAIPFP